MLLIFVPKITNRLGYTTNVVMQGILRTEFAITADWDTFQHHEGPKLAYGPKPCGMAGIPYFKSCKFLFRTKIDNYDPQYFTNNGFPALFPVEGDSPDLPFDPFAAIFYMLSRYEEYLPHKQDEHGRILMSELIAYKHNFLRIPVVEHWALMIKEVLLRYFPNIPFRPRTFRFDQTIDIDAAYCYLSKGLVRSSIGIFRDIVVRHRPQDVKLRMKVLQGKEADPFDTFDYIISKSKDFDRDQLQFFVLMGDYDLYDKPTPFYYNRFQELLKHIGDYAKLGIHGSYHSGDNAEMMENEIRRLSNIIHRPIHRNRFHFLRFSLPESYQMLAELGIIHDYTMGFAQAPGFRNGSCTPLPFFDLKSNQEMDLIVHPFVTMDTTFRNHLNLSPSKALELYCSLIDEVKSVNGTFSCIFHNQNLSETYGWGGWRNVYDQVIDYVKK
ncbi:MAG: polysaccharide deacetylase family protein [Bacteroidales bacterium]|nr:polysaccharide deacetylase family protein [Bacteroidales bacterium]